MRALIIAAAVTAAAGTVAGLLLAPSAGAAPHRSAHVMAHRTTGSTTITTPYGNPAMGRNGIGNDVIRAGIVPTALTPASETLLGADLLFPNPGGFSSQFRFTLPVVSSSGSTVRQGGGIMFSDRRGLVQITRLVLDLRHRVLTATITAEPGTPSRRVTLFRLTLTRRASGGQNTRTTVAELRITGTAAAALNRALSTKLFTAGRDFGTAVVHLRG
jgi:hypothetical protein